ncbi:MAG: hypothetical protein ACKVH7_09805, partial [Alphaproteobacteria bacterium]
MGSIHRLATIDDMDGAGDEAARALPQLSDRYEMELWYEQNEAHLCRVVLSRCLTPSSLGRAFRNRS